MTAIDAIHDYIAWLRTEKLPRSHNHYGIGRENYMKMLLYNEDITLTPEKVLEIGLNQLKKEQDVFNQAAQSSIRIKSRLMFTMIWKMSTR